MTTYEYTFCDGKLKVEKLKGVRYVSEPGPPRVYLDRKDDDFARRIFIASLRKQLKKKKNDISRIRQEIEILESMGKSGMKKYYIGRGDLLLTEFNALRECESRDEAAKELKKIRREILSGKFDSEYFAGCNPTEMTEGMWEEMRRIEAEKYFVYYINYTPDGDVRETGKI